jgi:hypothetical protein
MEYHYSVMMVILNKKSIGKKVYVIFFSKKKRGSYHSGFYFFNFLESLVRTDIFLYLQCYAVLVDSSLSLHRPPSNQNANYCRVGKRATGQKKKKKQTLAGWTIQHPLAQIINCISAISSQFKHTTQNTRSISFTLLDLFKKKSSCSLSLSLLFSFFSL